MNEERNDKVVATIRDQGLGIPALLLEDLFDATKKANRPGTSGEKGTGFGLPIVKAYVEKFGGMIKVDSKCRQEFKANSGTVLSWPLKSTTLLLKKFNYFNESILNQQRDWPCYQFQ